jgi:hypothetical protein
MPVAVEKLAFSEESRNLGDRKCLGDREKSFVELPDAIQLFQIPSERVFQQPPLFSTSILAAGRRFIENTTTLRDLLGTQSLACREVS